MPNLSDLKTTTKDDLAEILFSELMKRYPSGEMPLTKTGCSRVINQIMGTIVEKLSEGGRVSIRDLGYFHPVKKAECKARNVVEGTEVTVPERYSLRFKPSKQIKELLTEKLL